MASVSHEQSLADVEREHILKVLAECRGNRTHASKILDISIRGLRGKLLGYAQAGLQVPPVGTQTQTAPPSIGSVLALGSLTLDG
jgi:hypothetical protein